LIRHYTINDLNDISDLEKEVIIKIENKFEEKDISKAKEILQKLGYIIKIKTYTLENTYLLFKKEVENYGI